MKETSYYKYLLQVINDEIVNQDNNNYIILKINAYISLITLSNMIYNKDKIKKELSLLEEFLRKVNNLKVKIQLKRKDTEIDKVLENILNLYTKNKKIIDKYNKYNLNIIEILNTKDAKKITSLLDKITKLRIKKEHYFEEDYNKREEILKLLFTANYKLENDLLVIYNDEKSIKLKVDDFFELFDYLQDETNYSSNFLNNNNIISHQEIINNLIKIISEDNEKIDNKNIIPIILTNLLYEDLNNINGIEMNKFNIDNIKISDLYSFAQNKELDDKCAKWRQINIPNDYLFNKIHNLIAKGMYYYQDNMFTIENINNKVSDFKISISMIDLMDLIKNILNERIITSNIN